MMRSNFDHVFKLLIGDEGGYVNDPDDRGGPTKYGVTLGTLRAWRRDPRVTANDVKALTLAEAKLVFKKQYWDRVRADLLPSGLDYAVADFAYNSGPGHAVPTLQRVLGVGCDGIIGEITLAAIERADTAGVIKRYCAERLEFLKGTYGWRKYRKGWTKRVIGVRSESIRLALKLKAPSAPAPKPEPPKRDAQQPDPKKTPEAKGGLIAVIGTIGAAIADWLEQLTPYSEIEVVKYACLALTLAGIGFAGWKLVRKMREQNG